MSPENYQSQGVRGRGVCLCFLLSPVATETISNRHPPPAIVSYNIEEDSINVSWEMHRGTGQQCRAPLLLCSINTLANSMKHSINVSNYCLEGRAGGRGGAGGEVGMAANHSNRCGGKLARLNSADEQRPVRKHWTLHCLGKTGEEYQRAHLQQHGKLSSDCWQGFSRAWNEFKF